MSRNKLNYFTVTSTSVVAAKNKADAHSIARGRRGISGRLLNQETTVDRIPASEAHASVEDSPKTMTA